MQDQSHERRRRRSNDPLVALHYQLSLARAEGALDTIVVADAAGVVVAGAGAWAACEELAAYAPLLDRDGERMPPRIESLRGEVDVRRVQIGSETVLLCVRGSRGDAARTAVDRASEGVLRILAA
jgi:hypothetical protein